MTTIISMGAVYYMGRVRTSCIAKIPFFFIVIISFVLILITLDCNNIGKMNVYIILRRIIIPLLGLYSIDKLFTLHCCIFKQVKLNAN